jgi:hypothetical protein
MTKHAIGSFVMTLAIMSFTTLAVAQRVDANAILTAAPKIATSVGGVYAFPAPPKGFNPLTASNAQLLTYGLPERPDQAADARGYAVWERSMLALKIHATDVQATPYSSMNAILTGPPTTNVDGTTSQRSNNWSGIANTNKLTKWNASTSFNKVVSFWNTPVPNHPFGSVPCSEGPWFEVTWNGIGGFYSYDSLVQGGTASYWDGGGCKGSVETYGWIEWFPSYSILTVLCSGKPCPVNPGDDFLAISYGAAGTAEQHVFVEDLTQQWSGTFGLTYKSGPGLVGASAEYIVERPGCGNGCLNALGNYIFEFFNDSFANDGAGTQFYPGSTSSSTYVLTMFADDGSTPISFPFMYGTSGNQGKYSIFIEDENCAYKGGCAK